MSKLGLCDAADITELWVWLKERLHIMLKVAGISRPGRTHGFQAAEFVQYSRQIAVNGFV